MKLLIILLLFLSGCSYFPFTRVEVLDDCINDRTGEFDIGDCHIFPENVCKDIDGFCARFEKKKKNNSNKCLKEVAEVCEAYEERKNE